MVMDVNGTRFHLYLGESDWRPYANEVEDLAWDGERAMIGLLPLVFRFPTPPGDRIPTRADRRGAGRDRYGNWYWIDQAGTSIRYLPAHRREAQHLWSSLDVQKQQSCPAADFGPVSTPSPQVLQLCGLAVTKHHYLVVGVIDPPGVLVFDLHAGGQPVQMTWPATVPFAPFDMAPAPGGGVWILDEGPRYWALDRYFRVIAAGQAEQSISPAWHEDFGSEDVDPRYRAGRTFPTGITLAHASPLEAQRPMAIVGLPDGTVLILDSDPACSFSVLTRYRFGQQLGPAVQLERVLPISDGDAATVSQVDLWGYDMAFVPDTPVLPWQVSGTLYIAGADGNQSFALTLQARDDDWQVALLPRYLPMRRFNGVGLVGGQESASYHTDQDRWETLVAIRHPRYRPSASLVIDHLDGKEPDCVWHRLFLDGQIPPGSKVIVESRASNDKAFLDQLQWQIEPALYPRSTGSELPYHRPFDKQETQRAGVGTWELLFQRAVGRHLQLRITLQGTGRNTPRIRALRVYYPRFSYLREYLPAVYSYDEISASFVERFLANMEGTFSEIEGRVAQVQMLFDVDSIAAEYLGWLASWFGVALDATWDVYRRRLFLSHAMEMFGQRGTVSGLIRAIRLATDPCPDEALFEEDVGSYGLCSNGACVPHVNHSVRIVERFLTRSVPGVVYGDPSSDGGQPRHVPKGQDWTPADGAQILHARYRAFLEASYPPSPEYATSLAAIKAAWEDADLTSLNDVRFSPVPPSNPLAEVAWDRFRETELGFTYARVTSKDEETYQAFLARRYRHISVLNETYQWQGGDAKISFDRVRLPAENKMPTGQRELEDWIQFVSLVIPIERNAHWFTVLIPTDTGGDDQRTLAERKSIVERIVAIEKPAHTNFQVKPYWALFRVGEARVGLDTLLDEGSRFVALLLGHSYLAEGFIVPEEPWNVVDRMVVGRDQLGQIIDVEETKS